MSRRRLNVLLVLVNGSGQGDVSYFNPHAS
jgi:hypothetical protein